MAHNYPGWLNINPNKHWALFTIRLKQQGDIKTGRSAKHERTAGNQNDKGCNHHRTIINPLSIQNLD